VVAAGHPLTARAGADVLRAGGNAVDAAVASVLTSVVAEPLLTGFGGGGYLLAAPPGCDPVLLDFFVTAPGRDMDPAARQPLLPVDISFGDAVQAVKVGSASCGVPGLAAGLAAALGRFGTMKLAELSRPAAALARSGFRVTAQQAGLLAVLAPILRSSPEARAMYLTDDRPPAEGALLVAPELAASLDRYGEEGAEPFYAGEFAARIVEVTGGQVTAADLAAYEVVEREPVRVHYRGREVFTNPPPSAGGLLVAYALAVLARTEGPPGDAALVEAMLAAQDARTGEFFTDLPSPGFAARFLGSRLGSTTHISVLDDAGWACAVTCSNGEGSGVIVPGTGVQLNNMMGEEDLSPAGFFTHAPGDRLPSMMAPTVVRRDGRAELVVGSAGSKRIRSTLLQVIVNAVDRELPAQEAVDAPRLHVDDGVVYAEPGIDARALEALGHVVTRFRDRNLFFGGCQAAELSGEVFSGGGDPRRGGAVAYA
jgi:gamma-glutamyltranspeptidase/glutathione hydrolase